jgi:hypothetical protein
LNVASQASPTWGLAWRTTDIYDLRTGWERGEKGDVRGGAKRVVGREER